MAIKLTVGNIKANLHVGGDEANLSLGGGTTVIKNYNILNNKPQINGVELIGNKTFADLGLEIDETPTEDSENAVSSGGVYDALEGKEDVANKVTSIDPASTDAEYPSAKAVYDFVEEKAYLKCIVYFDTGHPENNTATMTVEKGELEKALENPVRVYGSINGGEPIDYGQAALQIDQLASAHLVVFPEAIQKINALINIQCGGVNFYCDSDTEEFTFMEFIKGSELMINKVSAIPVESVYTDVNRYPSIRAIRKMFDDLHTEMESDASASKTLIDLELDANGDLVPTFANIAALPSSTKYGASITVSIDSDYKVTTTLKDQDGNVLGSAQVIDLPIESVVVGGSYDAATKKVILTLENGNTVEFSVADLVSGLQSEITPSNKLSADLVDDSASTHKFTTEANLTKLAGIEAGAEANVQSDWNETNNASDAYIKNKPSIPTKTSDLTNDGEGGTSRYVEAQELADVATTGNYHDLQNTPIIPTHTSDLTNDSGFISSESDPTVPSWAKESTKPTYTYDEVGALGLELKGSENGVAELDANGHVPTSQLPSYVDDVLEYSSQSAFPATGETGKIYVDTSTNKTYRWSGSQYVEISPSLALGETSATAYRGDRGKAAYDHAQAHGSAFASGLYKVATNAEGHVTGATAVVKSDITALGIPAQDTTYDAATQSANGLMTAADKAKLDGIEAGAQVNPATYASSKSAAGPADKAVSIPYAQVDSTSTATNFTATVPGITELRNGVCVLLKNGVVTSASGFKININGLGAKPSVNNMTAATLDTTIFNINYTMLFVYDETRVSGGCWICYRGYDANTNTIGYQLRTNSYSLPMKSITYRYRLLFTSADGKGFVPANNSSSTNATDSRTVCQDKIDPFGSIVYYGTTASVAAGLRPSATNLWQEYTLSLGYSFNRTGAALTLTSWKPVYVKAAPQTDGSAIIDSTTPYVQDLPTTADGKIYIFLGVAYSATSIELTLNHPVYHFADGAIREWVNTPKNISYFTNDAGYLTSYTETDPTVPAWAKAPSKPTYTASEVGALPNTTVIPSKTSDLTNDSDFTTKTYVDGLVGNVEAALAALR